MNRKINRSKFLQKYICVHISCVNMLLFPKMLSALGPPKKNPQKNCRTSRTAKKQLEKCCSVCGLGNPTATKTLRQNLIQAERLGIRRPK